jgi:hypothetical protein
MHGAINDDPDGAKMDNFLTDVVNSIIGYLQISTKENKKLTKYVNRVLTFKINKAGSDYEMDIPTKKANLKQMKKGQAPHEMGMDYATRAPHEMEMDYPTQAPHEMEMDYPSRYRDIPTKKANLKQMKKEQTISAAGEMETDYLGQSAPLPKAERGLLASSYWAVADPLHETGLPGYPPIPLPYQPGNQAGEPRVGGGRFKNPLYNLLPKNVEDIRTSHPAYAIEEGTDYSQPDNVGIYPDFAMGSNAEAPMFERSVTEACISPCAQGNRSTKT